MIEDDSILNPSLWSDEDTNITAETEKEKAALINKINRLDSETKCYNDDIVNDLSDFILRNACDPNGAKPIVVDKEKITSQLKSLDDKFWDKILRITRFRLVEFQAKLSAKEYGEGRDVAVMLKNTNELIRILSSGKSYPEIKSEVDAIFDKILTGDNLKKEVIQRKKEEKYLKDNDIDKVPRSGMYTDLYNIKNSLEVNEKLFPSWEGEVNVIKNKEEKFNVPTNSNVAAPERTEKRTAHSINYGMSQDTQQEEKTSENFNENRIVDITENSAVRLFDKLHSGDYNEIVYDELPDGTKEVKSIDDLEDWLESNSVDSFAKKDQNVIDISDSPALYKLMKDKEEFSLSGLYDLSNKSEEKLLSAQLRQLKNKQEAVDTPNKDGKKAMENSKLAYQAYRFVYPNISKAKNIFDLLNSGNSVAMNYLWDWISNSKIITQLRDVTKIVTGLIRQPYSERWETEKSEDVFPDNYIGSKKIKNPIMEVGVNERLLKERVNKINPDETFNRMMKLKDSDPSVLLQFGINVNNGDVSSTVIKTAAEKISKEYNSIVEDINRFISYFDAFYEYSMRAYKGITEIFNYNTYQGEPVDKSADYMKPYLIARAIKEIKDNTSDLSDSLEKGKKSYAEKQKYYSKNETAWIASLIKLLLGFSNVSDLSRYAIEKRSIHPMDESMIVGVTDKIEKIFDFTPNFISSNVSLVNSDEDPNKIKEDLKEAKARYETLDRLHVKLSNRVGLGEAKGVNRPQIALKNIVDGTADINYSNIDGYRTAFRFFLDNVGGSIESGGKTYTSFDNEVFLDPEILSKILSDPKVIKQINNFLTNELQARLDTLETDRKEAKEAMEMLEKKNAFFDILSKNGGRIFRIDDSNWQEITAKLTFSAKKRLLARIDHEFDRVWNRYQMLRRG